MMPIGGAGMHITTLYEELLDFEVIE